MKGICQSCGESKELKGCSLCGAMICTNCSLENGCKICRGRLQG